MHHPFLNKYLLLSAVALTALVFDALMEGSGPKPASTPNSPLSTTPGKDPKRPESVASHTSLNQPPPATYTDLPAGLSESGALAQKLQAIEADYHALAQPILEKSLPIIEAEDRAKLAYLDQEKFKDMGTLLSTSELDVYQNQINLASAPKRR